jgi:hypothetical protein
MKRRASRWALMRLFGARGADPNLDQWGGAVDDNQKFT